MISSAIPAERASSTRNRLILIGLWIIFYAGFTLFTPPLLDDADSVHAEVAREMILRHDWVTLYANGIRYLEKAPVLYWSMAASFKLFGVSTAAARLPLALSVLALLLTLEAFARRAFQSTRAGLYAGLVLLSSFGIFIFTRILIPDLAVCLWLTLAMLCFWKTEQQEQPSRWLCYGFAACCALNVLTKGLIGIVFPVVIVLAYLLLTRNVPRGTFLRLRQLHPLSSLAVFFAIAAPWHILIGLANPTQGHPGGVAFVHGHWSVPLPTDGNVHGWFWFYFVNEQVLRYLNLRVPRDYDTVPLLLFWGLLLIWLMPWSAFIFNDIAAIRRDRTRLLLGLWAAIPMLFFSFSTRQEYYVLPAIPALVLLLAAWLDEDAKEPGIAGRRIAVVLFAFGTIASAMALFFAYSGTKPSANMDLASMLQQNPGDYALSFGHFLDLNREAMGAFRVPLLLTAIALFGSSLAHLLLRRRGKAHAANLALAAGAFGFLLAAHLGLQTFSPVLTSRQLAAAIAPQLKAQDLIVIHGEYEAASTLGFYLRRNDLHILEGRSSNLWYGSFFPDAPKIFETKESLAARWPGPQRIFLWQDLSNDPGPLPVLPGPVYLIFKSGGKEILSNRMGQ
ncbi:ArnT family glycosyltransferase [Granulicella arctica]|uniref:4-amino-4-deoxy-L-arabinose transferase-like glycosyltransferase n=1 Tax=Granulicella arctica TaxID=940613 RepID=A0A7Y9TRX1_9BACT|nr:phospholipid carrier-dependent glycosyltransferase [Granulicella arctica]NYF78538.1 4-amino-4-deoxy-L-arabinose transferase-like glycosyltransferase [Granulicella arctica]